jgi:hypothetical protein
MEIVISTHKSVAELGVIGQAEAMHRIMDAQRECQRRGEGSCRARGVAARTTRKAKRHEPQGQLVERWRAELAAVGWPVERLAASVDAASQARQPA